ncbi:MAG: hypothetical protein HYS27_20850 [Deltaproteobacteria bacterium]|nr:hypothetical protein [Deltaproteobacteria bacterium]
MRRTLPLLLLCCAMPAAATSSFPATLRDKLTLDRAPQCTVCHVTGSGGDGTATKPFAVSMVAAGLEPFDEASLEAAVAQLDADGTDSDGDGAGDVEELRAGTDPNAPPGTGLEGEGEGEGEPVEYGFGCAGAPDASVAVLALLWLRRRSRRCG